MVSNSHNNVLYIGMTNDLERRIGEHKAKAIKGFTAKYNCNKLVWFEEHLSSDDALKREKLLKRWRREWKDQLIEKNNPGWADLADGWK